MDSTFDTLLRELAVTRSRYETLRSSGQDLAARAEALSRLHGLRASIAQVRGLL